MSEDKAGVFAEVERLARAALPPDPLGGAPPKQYPLRALTALLARLRISVRREEAERAAVVVERLKQEPAIRPRLLAPFLDLGYSLSDASDCTEAVEVPAPIARGRPQSFYYAPAHALSRRQSASSVNRRQRSLTGRSMPLHAALVQSGLVSSSPPGALALGIGALLAPPSPSPSPPPSHFPHRDWTKEFQEALEMPSSEPAERLLRSKRVREVATEFAELATRHGRSIIAEAFLPPGCSRTLLPFDAGAAGGQKYLVEGIFFKFAVDMHGLYGGDEYAMKAAGHELLGVNAYFNASIPGLYLPLIAVIDYCGFRLVATSEIPIEPGSLVYGSSDGGHTVLCDPVAAQMMEQAARVLNIKGHRAGEVTLHAPCDIEVHRARDGRLFVLDAARVFPPERPIRSRVGSHLYMLLRPELVRASPVPLSSDAFTLFGGQDNTREHNEEVASAQRKLLLEIIPNVAISLNQRAKRLLAAGGPRMTIRQLADGLQLVTEVHKEGINIRYLPLLKRTEGVAMDPRLCVVINTEIAARRAKNRLREYMRAQLRSGCQSLDLTALVEAVNMLICIVSLQAIGTEGVDMPFFLERLQAMLGLRLADGAAERVAAESLLDDTDILEIVPRVRHTSTVPYEEGVALYQQAQDGHNNPEEADRLLQVAAEKFQLALQKQADDYKILTHWGILLVQRAKLLDQRSPPAPAQERDALFEAAVQRFADAVRARRGYRYALMHWGEALQLWATTKPADQARVLRLQAEQKLKEADLLGKRWFFGTLPTSGVRGLLTTPRSSSAAGKSRGAFFIRTSSSRPGHFIFSVIVRDPKDMKERLRDILIEETREGKYFLAVHGCTAPSPTTPLYDTLEDLVFAKINEGYKPVLNEWFRSQD